MHLLELVEPTSTCTSRTGDSSWKFGSAIFCLYKLYVQVMSRFISTLQKQYNSSLNVYSLPRSNHTASFAIHRNQVAVATNIDSATTRLILTACNTCAPPYCGSGLLGAVYSKVESIQPLARMGKIS